MKREGSTEWVGGSRDEISHLLTSQTCCPALRLTRDWLPLLRATPWSLLAGLSMVPVLPPFFSLMLSWDTPWENSCHTVPSHCSKLPPASLHRSQPFILALRAERTSPDICRVPGSRDRKREEVRAQSSEEAGHAQDGRSA